MNNSQKEDFIYNFYKKLPTSDYTYVSQFESTFVLDPIELEINGIPELDSFLSEFFPNITPMQYSQIKREAFSVNKENDSHYVFEGELGYTRYQYICTFSDLYDVLKKMKAPIIRAAILE